MVEHPAECQGHGTTRRREVRAGLHLEHGVVGEGGAHDSEYGPAQCAGRGSAAGSCSGVRTKNAPTTAATDRNAATTNAACTPPAAASTSTYPDSASVAARTLNTLTSSATPAAPASCCVAPNTALPYE